MPLPQFRLYSFRLVTAFLLSLFCCSTVWGQATASILGTVRDSSGAVVPNVKVTVTNTQTNLTRNVSTDGQGDYVISALPIGPYRVIAELQGFKQSEVPGVILQVAQQARVNIQLEPGNISSSVVVSTAPSLLTTDSSAVGQVIDNKKIVDLPLNGRDFTQLASLTPGAITSNIGGNSGEQHGFTTISVSGGQSSKTEVLLDGITDQEELYDGVLLSPSVDAIQEFRVQSNAFSAEYGRGSAIVNLTIKSGTNEFHGTVFEFFRNDKLDARNFFATQKAPRRQNQFGGSVGGPILKNKLFFFGNYEGARIRLPQTNNVRVPSQALRSGDLSSRAKQIIDPATGAAFPNNQIPTNRIDPIANYFLQFVPIPNTPGGTFVWNASGTRDFDQGNGRLDYLIDSKDTLSLRYSGNFAIRSSPGSLPTSGGTAQTINSQNSGVGYTHIFSPSFLNELRLGYVRLYYANNPQGLGTNHTLESGIKGFEQTSLNFPGFPSIGVSTYTSFTNGVGFAPIINPTNTYQLTDTASLTKGRHNLRFGIDFRKWHATSTNSAFSRGSFSFNGQYSGDPLADYLLGYPSSGIRDFPRNQFGVKDNNYDFFVQDDIKVNSKLTVNVGLRYELNMAPTQDLGQNSYFDNNTGKWIVSTYKNGQINLTTQQVAPLAYAIYKDNIVTAKQAGLDNSLQTSTFNQWAPRIGFAYRPFDNDKTVIRSGYGIYYLLSRGNQSVSNAIINLPFILDESKSNSKLPNGTPAFTTANFFDAPFGFGGPLLSEIDLKYRPPYMQQWNFAVQREVLKGLAAEIAYVGNKGTRLERDVPFNFAVPGPGPRNSRRKWTQYGNGDNYTNVGNSIYHALQTKLEKRYSSGLTFLATYTWSKLIDDSNVSSNGFTTEDPRNLSLDRGLGETDIPHRFVTSFSYELPFGRGKLIGKDMSRGLNLLAGGWTVAGIVQYQSGFPFTPSMSDNPTDTDYGFHPDRLGSGTVSDPTIQRWFDPTAFSVPALYQIGTSGRNILRGPGIKNWDISILKNTYFTERVYNEFRFEAFNIFNTPQFSNPDSNIQSPTAGQIFGARDPRIIQLAMKIYF